MPYGGNGKPWSTGRVIGACLVIIDATTVFFAGGHFGKSYFNFIIFGTYTGDHLVHFIG